MEKLRFVSTWCNVAGISAWCMATDKKSGKFSSFKLSFSQVRTWWCLTCVTVHLAAVAMMAVLSAEIFTLYQSAPTVLTMDICQIPIAWNVVTYVDAVNLMAFLSLALMPPLVSLQFKRFASACRLLRQVDEALGHDPWFPAWFPFDRYALIAVICFFVPVASFVGAMGPLYGAVLPRLWSANYLLAVICVPLTLLQIGAMLGLFVFSQQSVACRIKVLARILKNIDQAPPPIVDGQNTGSCLLTNLKMVQRAYSRLRQAVRKMDDSFSFVSLVVITIKTITLTCVSFNIIIIVFYSKQNLYDKLYWIGSSVAADCLTLFVMLYPASDRSEQMEKLDQELMFVANKRLSTDQLLMVVGLKQEIGQMPTKGSAAGVFDSGLDLLPSILATMITYVIIIVQWIITAQSNTDIEIANGVCPVWI